MEKAHLFDPILANTSPGNKQLRERLDQLKEELAQHQKYLRLAHVDVNREVERRLGCNDLIPQREVANFVRNIRSLIENEVRKFNISQPRDQRLREHPEFNKTPEDYAQQ